MSTRTWDSVHHRGEILRRVTEVADSRRDGVPPLDLPGVPEVFGDEFGLVTALQLRWHTRLAGRMEQALTDEPAGLEQAVLTAWRATAAELAGVRLILDRAAQEPSSPELEQALTIARHKEWTLLAVMAGQGTSAKSATLRAGHRLEELARAEHDPAAGPRQPTAAQGRRRSASLVDRLRAHLAA